MLKSSYTVLLVDDEALPRKLMESGIREMSGITVVGLSNGLSAKRYLLEHVVDLVITDIMMPFMDGLELAEFVKEFSPLCPVVIISGYGEFEYAQKAIQYGVKDYLLKPIQLKNLVQVVEKCSQEIGENREKQLLKKYSEFEELEYQMSRTFTKGASAKVWIDALKSIMPDQGNVVSMKSSVDDKDKKDERNMKYKNILNIAFPNQIVLCLGYVKDRFYYLIIFKQNENHRLMKAIPEYLDRIFTESVEWEEICAVNSPEELAELADNFRKEEGNVLIESACRYMKEHLGDALSREAVAEHVYLSPSHFGHLFKQTMGMGYNAYLTQMRIEQAQRLLQKNMLVSDVASKVGFHDAKYFSEIFYKKTGYVPSEYRRALLNGEIPQDEEG